MIIIFILFNTHLFAPYVIPCVSFVETMFYGPPEKIKAIVTK